MIITRRVASLLMTFSFLAGPLAVAQETGVEASTGEKAGEEKPVAPLPLPRQLLPGQKLRPGDSVAVLVLDEATVSGAFRIGEDGQINYPLLGKVMAAGLSLDELSTQIKGLLENDFIRKAEVSTTMTDRQENSVFVYGAVNSQGPVNYDPDKGLTLGRAVAMVGGTNEMANLAKVKIQRSSGDDLEAIVADLNRQQNFALEDGDIIVIPIVPTAVASSASGSNAPSALAMPATGRVIVMGEVGRTGTVEVALEGGTDILEVIALSGGFTRLARPSKVKVRREKADGTAETLVVDVEKMRNGDSTAGFRVLPGDTVFVPESVF